jgi:catechol 2,3-dioxygenase-like lactoylglutathione lyase family enzyme
LDTLHHIAIGTPHLEKMVEFYSKLPGLSFLEWKYDESNGKRSGWFLLQENIILMIEKRTYSKAPEALVLSLKAVDPTILFIDILPPPTSTTEYSFYFEDPDKNTVGYSNYPQPLGEWRKTIFKK